MGTSPPCGQTDGWMEGQTLVKTLPSLVLRTRAVNSECSYCERHTLLLYISNEYAESVRCPEDIDMLVARFWNESGNYKL